MQDLPLFEALLTIAVSIAGWFLRSLWNNQTALEKAIMQHQYEAAEKYVRKDDYRADITVSQFTPCTFGETFY